jgi:NIMA (never in mitosis gene a)-related kinase
MIKDYIIEERLGVGSYGTVYKVRKKNSNQLYVIKQISLLGLGDQQKNEYKLEASLLSSINSNYVVKYYTSFEETNNLNIVMEYCNGGDLFQFLEEKKKTKHLLSENLIWELFIKMILGLSAIHKMKILKKLLNTFIL